MDNGIVSVIIINWNGKRWIKKCLDSLFSQTYKQIEVVLVDNNSNDNSVEFVKKNYPDAKIIKNQDNLGYARGKNTGIDNAKGEYILSLDNDTWLDADFIEKMVVFYKNNKFDIIGPLENGYENDGLPVNNYLLRIDPFGHCAYLENNISGKENFYLAGNCLFFKKSLYKETGGLDSNFFMYFEEVDWFWRLNLLKKSFGIVDNLYVHHAGSGSTGRGIKYKLFLWRNQNTLQMLLKNYAWFNLLWVLPIYFLQNIVEMLIFLVVGRPKISFSYLAGWWFNVKKLPLILKKRKWVQKHRVAGELEIFKKMYLGLGKLRHLTLYYRLKLYKKG